MHFPKQTHGLTVLAQCAICRGEKVNRNELYSYVGPICSIWWGPLDILLAFRLGLQNVTARQLSVFSGVRTILFLPPLYLFVAEAAVRNFSTQLLMVLRSGNFPCLSLLKCRLDIRYVVMTEDLFWKKKRSVRRKHGVHPTSDSCLLKWLP
jgi:hypothetical protein